MERSLGLKIVAAVVTVTTLRTASLAHADNDISRGKELFALCGTCHGTPGQGDLARGAAALAGLQRWYVEAQLQKFRSGHRAYHAADVMGLQMRPMARTLTNDQALSDVAAYLRTLRK